MPLRAPRLGGSKGQVIQGRGERGLPVGHRWPLGMSGVWRYELTDSRPRLPSIVYPGGRA